MLESEIETVGEKSKTTQTIENGNAWTSIFPNSESTVEVTVKDPAVGLINTLRKLIVLELPLVKLFPSAIEVADILTPGFKLVIVKVPKANPVAISTDSITAWVEPTVETTTKVVLTVLKPAPAILLAEPITSPEDIFEISKEPASDVNNEVNISTSPASWLKITVKSVKLSQSVLESEIETVGEKSLRFWAIIWLGFNKKPKQKINIKFDKIWVKFLFIIFFLILVLILVLILFL